MVSYLWNFRIKAKLQPSSSQSMYIIFPELCAVQTQVVAKVCSRSFRRCRKQQISGLILPGCLSLRASCLPTIICELKLSWERDLKRLIMVLSLQCLRKKILFLVNFVLEWGIWMLLSSWCVWKLMTLTALVLSYFLVPRSFSCIFLRSFFSLWLRVLHWVTYFCATGLSPLPLAMELFRPGKPAS